MLSVLRQMITWEIDEDKIKREVNPAANMEKNLPKKKKGERMLSLQEAREAWRAARGSRVPLRSGLPARPPDRKPPG
jgi:hypothetical protein